MEAPYLWNNSLEVYKALKTGIRKLFDEGIREVDFVYNNVDYDIRIDSIKTHFGQPLHRQKPVYVVSWGNAERGVYSSIDDLEDMPMHDGCILRNVFPYVRDLNLW